jgi:hypothetical protein
LKSPPSILQHNLYLASWQAGLGICEVKRKVEEIRKMEENEKRTTDG